MNRLETVIDLAESGHPEAGRELWGMLATYREQGLDFSEMPPELVAWFDRRLEALTNIPAATKMGCQAPADEAARLLTPHERTSKEDLAALCLWPREKPPKDGPGAPRLRRKQKADRILAAMVFEFEAARKAELIAVGRGYEIVPLEPIFRSVSRNHSVSSKRVARAVKPFGISAQEAEIVRIPFISKRVAEERIRALIDQGLFRQKDRDTPLRPGYFRAFVSSKGLGHIEFRSS